MKPVRQESLRVSSVRPNQRAPDHLWRAHSVFVWWGEQHHTCLRHWLGRFGLYNPAEQFLPLQHGLNERIS